MNVLGERIRQLREASAIPTPGDYALARELLDDPKLFALLTRQEPRDVLHGVNTARWLLQRGHDDTSLLHAALLHDAGKGRQRRQDRAAWVVAQTLRSHDLLAHPSSRFELRRASARTRMHSVTGAAMLAEAGADEEVIRLTRLHHASPGGDAVLALLQAADAAS